MELLSATDIKNSGKQVSCRQCGICCTKGGAALHGEDFFLLQQGLIPRQNLITIRKGELAYNPITDKVQPTKAEIVKLRGTGREWTCCYYDALTTGCSIYENRPLACRALKCWDPEESLSLVETDLLSRLDILKEDEPLLELVKAHNSTCSLPDFASLSQVLQQETVRTVAELETLINRDLSFRNKVVEDSEVVFKEELFLFGRPLFQLLHSFDLSVFQEGHCLRLQWRGNT